MKKILAAVVAAVVISAGVTVLTPSSAEATARTNVGQRRKVVAVTDGDTIRFGNGERVRLVGVDTPERGECGYRKATANMERLVRGKVVTVISRKGTDRYDRSLYGVRVKVEGKWVNVQANQIRRGLADARYDGRDGYGWHRHQSLYRRLDRQHPDVRCNTSTKPSRTCHSAYTPCVPPPQPDLDCGDIRHKVYVNHTFGDPHRFDADKDGVGCESYG